MAAKKTAKKAPAKKKAAAKKAPAKKAPAKKKAAAKKAPAKKAPAKKKAAAKKAPAKKAPAKKKAAAKKPKYTPEQVYSMIEQAAYFAGQNDGFRKDPAEYWTQAEAQINEMIKG